MKRTTGFTLVELLVVIAIIAILAGIVIPNVPKFINKARGVRAYTEVKGIDLALTKMLTDVNRSDFANGFFDLVQADYDVLNALEMADAIRDVYTPAFYILLKKGKYAESDSQWPAILVLDEEVKRKLGDQYMDLANDPWGELYNFYPGPVSGQRFIENTGLGNDRIVVPFRTYQIETGVPGGPDIAGDQSDAMRDVVDPDDPDGLTFTVGYPASRKNTQYVWSNGKNKRSNQYFNDGYLANAEEVGLDFIGGGDDINNWDNGQSWTTFYN